MFPPKDKQMANKCMKRCSMSLIIREMQIKTIMHLQMQIKTTTMTSCWSEWPSSDVQTVNAGEGVEEKKPSCMLVGM